MRFLEYGNQNNKAIILIHGYSISWKMWLPQIDFFSKDYYVIVPILDGHDLKNSSTFTTVEQAATDIIDYVKGVYGEEIYALCGASLGATIGIDILAKNQLKINKAIIDAGPVVPMNKLMLYLSIKIRLRQINSMKKGDKRMHNMLNRSFYSKELVEEILKIGANMTEENCRNIHLSVYNYSLPSSLKTVKTDLAYWYGSKEAWFGKKYAKAISKTLPKAEIKVFQGLNHGELCIGDPELYIKEATAFFQR